MKTKTLALFIAFCIVLLSFSSCSSKLSAEQVFNKCNGAVFYVESFDEDGNLIATGSGFFVSEDGKGVTNWHVLENAYSARITLPSTGTKYDIEKCNVDTKKDWAVFTVNGKGFDYLTIGDSSTITNGAEIYTIGSPLGIKNTISSGIISNTNTVIDKQEYIQITAPISHGSSGGALINKYGEVIGITSATVSDGQNINLAIPIWKVNRAKTPDLSMTDCARLSAELHPVEYLKNYVQKNGIYTVDTNGLHYYLEVDRAKQNGGAIVISIEYDDTNLGESVHLVYKCTMSSWTFNTELSLAESGISLGGTDDSRPKFYTLGVYESIYNNNGNGYSAYGYIVPDEYELNDDRSIVLLSLNQSNYSNDVKNNLKENTSVGIYNILLFTNHYFKSNDLFISMKTFGFQDD